MTAGILSDDKIFAVGGNTWHHMETFTDRIDTWREAFAHSGARKATLRPIYVDGLPISTHVAVMVPGIAQPLAVVSKQYRLLDPEHVFSFMDPIVASGYGTWESGGTLMGQKIVWALVKLDETFEPRPGDPVRNYAFVSDARDGSQSVRVALINERVVCKNTFDIAMREGGINITHKEGVADKLLDVQEFMGLTRVQLNRQKYLYTRMAQQRVENEALKAFTASLLPLPKMPDTEKVERLQSWEITREHVTRDRLRVQSLFHGSGVGIDDDSYWSLFNAVTEWADHHRQPFTSASNRFYANRLGVGAQIKGRAMQLIGAAIS